MLGTGREERRDRELSSRLSKGDAGALAELYDAHSQRLYGHALWLLRRKEEAEDVVHDVLVKFASLGAELLRVRRPLQYLLRMVHLASLDVLSKRAKRAEGDGAPAYFDPDGFDPERARQAREAEDMLDTLPADQREAIWLHLFEDLTFREVARVTGVSTFTAASRYRLAVEKLRRLFGGG